MSRIGFVLRVVSVMRFVWILIVVAFGLQGQSPELIADYTQFVGRLLGLEWTAAQREVIRGHVKGYWRNGDRQAMRVVESSAKAWQRYRQEPQYLLDATFGMMRVDTLLGLQKAAREGAADSAYLLNLYYQAHPILAGGREDGLPLTRDAVEAGLAIEHWLATEIHRYGAPKPDAKVVERAIESAVRRHAGLSGAEQIQVVRQMGEWARIRNTWPQAGAVDRLIARRDLGAKLTAEEEAMVQQVLAGLQAQLNGMVSQHRNAMFQSAMESFKQNTDTILGRGTVWNPATNRWEQQGGIVTEYNGTVRVP